MVLQLIFHLLFQKSIDEDFLRLIDEVDLQQELKEAGDAILDPDRFPQYVREKSIKAVSKFLVSSALLLAIIILKHLCNNLRYPKLVTYKEYFVT